jgi:hypothetical protein
LAVLSAQQTLRLFSSGAAERIIVFAIRHVSTNDIMEFFGIYAHYTQYFSLTQNHTSSPAISGGYITFDAAGLLYDNGYLVVIASSEGGGNIGG